MQVVVERPGELIPRCFWLLNASEEMSGEDLLALYRKRGKAEGHWASWRPLASPAPGSASPGPGTRPAGSALVDRPGEMPALLLAADFEAVGGTMGELMSVVAPALSSTSRRKSHYRGKEIRKREKGVDAFACNQVRLLLAGFGYQIMHVQRAVLERVTGTGWSLRRTGACSPAGLRPCTDPPDSGATARRRTLPRPRRPQGRRGVSKRRRKARPSRTTTPFGPETPVFGPRNRPDLPSGLPSRVAKGPSAPHLTLDPEVHE